MSKRRATALGRIHLEPPTGLTPSARSGRQPGRISIDRVQPNPDQPRKNFKQADLLLLAADIASNGLQHPISVTAPDDTGTHTIIAGERRWRACKLASVTAIDVILDYDISDPDDMFDKALSENIQREDLTRAELAAALRRIKDRHLLTDEEVAKRCNKSIDWVRQHLAFNDLASPAQRFMEEHDQPVLLAKVLRNLPPDAQLEILQGVQDMPNRDAQMQRIGAVKELMTSAGFDAATAVAVAATPTPPNTEAPHLADAATASASPRPRRILQPFVVRLAPDGSTIVECHPAYLDVMRLGAKRLAATWEWERAVLDDLAAFHDALTSEAGGGAMWLAFREKVLDLLNADTRLKATADGAS